MTIAIALTFAAMATVAAVVVRRRRSRRARGLAPELDPLPAGLKHLGATVSDLSDCGVHLHVARANALARKPRLGVLLGLH